MTDLVDETEEEESEELTKCPECGHKHPEGDMLRDWWGTIALCPDCGGVCNECDNARPSDTLSLVGGEEVCEACSSVCRNCSERVLNDDLRFLDYEDMHVCDECAVRCDDCDNYYLDGNMCSSCGTSVRNLNGYGSTEPFMWLGGPLPKVDGHQDGYYLGFELEIFAETGDANVVNRWAAEHLTSHEAVECKKDSTVEGFEIATQPMTPQFFEGVDWESFFVMLEDNFPLRGEEESTEHGLHVHIGRTAFERDDFSFAAFAYLLGQGNHLERIARRQPTSYCRKVDKPVSAAIMRLNDESPYREGRRPAHAVQAQRARSKGVYPQRDAINMTRSTTVEIRAFRSTRSADDLRAAVRVVYLAADYIRDLRRGNALVSPRALHWSEFSRWVGVHHPEAFASVAGIPAPKGNGYKPEPVKKSAPEVADSPTDPTQWRRATAPRASGVPTLPPREAISEFTTNLSNYYFEPIRAERGPITFRDSRGDEVLNDLEF